MTSKVLDLTTVAHALNKLCDTFLGETEWSGNDQQQEFLTWYTAHRDEIQKLDSLDALASTDYDELNQFLIAHGFDPMFGKFVGLGVASILDMLVEWVTEGEPTTISRYEKAGGVGYLTLETAVDYPAFEIGSAGVGIYNAAGFEHPLLRLHTKTGHSVWLMKADEPGTGLELNSITQRLLTTDLKPHLNWTAGAIIPMLEIDLEADVLWMIGLTASSAGHDDYRLQQAFQRFKLRANDKGARVKVVTGMVFTMAACGPPPKQPYVLNDPFIGFFTQPGHDTVPLAAFWADTDVWQNPAGTLEEL